MRERILKLLNFHFNTVWMDNEYFGPYLANHKEYFGEVNCPFKRLKIKKTPLAKMGLFMENQ